MMKAIFELIRSKRIVPENSLFGGLYCHIDVDGRQDSDYVYLCDTGENLEKSIPAGRYKISVDMPSQRFSSRLFYKYINNGNVPRVLNVPHRSGILIHCGNYPANDSQGCILVGTCSRNYLYNSKNAYQMLCKMFSDLRKLNKDITFELHITDLSDNEPF